MPLRVHHPFALCSALALTSLIACGGSTASTDSTTSSSEDELTATRESLAESRAQAEACFTKFRQCVESGGDQAKCRDDLKVCLPAAPPPPPRCGGHPGHGPRPGPRPDVDGGFPPPPPPPPDGPGADGPPPPPDGAHACGDGGASPPPPPPSEGRGDHNAGRCGPPPIPPDELRACRDALDQCVQGGGDRETCLAAHQECVRDAFAKHFAELCQRAQTDCSSGVAPADACGRILQACKDGVAPP